MTKTLLAVRDSKGPVGLTKQLGRGGEGAVFEVTGRPDLVAKVYHKPIDAQKAAKIQAMAAMRTDRLISLTAWPVEVLRTPRGEPCGLLMPKVTGHKDIHHLYSPRSRKSEFPNADWRFLVRAAANTARAFAVIHEAKCVIGDVNHGGVVVSDKATVKLIDCDSFQVTSGGQKFLCEVGVPTFTPPELQGKPFRGVIRTPNHDSFGLAIMIFHLLFMGKHPFAGRFLGQGEMSIEQAITEYRFAYGADRTAMQMKPPPNVPSIATASQPVALLLERAFSRDGSREGGRPSACEWITALEQLEKQLKQCHVNASHHYLNTLPHCPWCHLEAATGVILFNVYIAHGGTYTGMDVTTLWAKITTIQPPGPPPTLLDRSALANLKPSNAAISAARSRKIGQALRTILIIGGVIALLAFFPEAFIIWLIGGLIAWSILGKGDGDEGAAFQATARSAAAQYNTILERWRREASEQAFHAKLGQLERLRDQLQNLPNLRQRRYHQQEQERHHQQLKRFLERFEIERASISGIGPGRKAMLASYNVETAWDVTERKVLRVPGFGPAMSKKLMEWRRTQEKKFRFNPAEGVDPRDIAALDREIADTKRKLQQGLVTGATELAQIRNQIVAQRNALKHQVDEAFKAMVQAEINAKAASGG